MMYVWIQFITFLYDICEYIYIYIFVDNNDFIIDLLVIDFASLWTNTHM